MSNISPPPINEAVTDESGTPTLPWILFFNNLFVGDTGTDWIPAFTSLGITGTPTITGRYYRISQGLVYFRVTIVPATNTTSTAGTTYINNFPLDITGDGACLAVSGGLGDGPGHIIASNDRIYTPAWSAVTVPLTVIGMMEVK